MKPISGSVQNAPLVFFLLVALEKSNQNRLAAVLQYTKVFYAHYLLMYSMMD